MKKRSTKKKMNRWNKRAKTKKIKTHLKANKKVTNKNAKIRAQK